MSKRGSEKSGKITSFFNKASTSASVHSDTGEDSDLELDVELQAHASVDMKSDGSSRHVGSGPSSQCWERAKAPKKRRIETKKFSPGWTKMFPWLTYCQADNTMKCKVCSQSGRPGVWTEGTRNFRSGLLSVLLTLD